MFAAEGKQAKPETHQGLERDKSARASGILPWRLRWCKLHTDFVQARVEILGQGLPLPATRSELAGKCQERVKCTHLFLPLFVLPQRELPLSLHEVSHSSGKITPIRLSTQLLVK